MGERRIEFVDGLRGFALFGILLVNIPYFASSYWPGSGLNNPQATSSLDTAAELFVSYFFESKFYLLFALLFGYSFVLQQQAAERDGAAFVPRMLRRSLGLFVLGLVHVVFLWFGDILMLYAVLTLILIGCRNIKPRTAVIAAGALLGTVTLALLALTYYVAYVNPGLFGVDKVAGTAEAYRSTQAFLGSFSESMQQRLADVGLTQPMVFLIQGPIAAAMMLLGLAAAKKELFSNLGAIREYCVKYLRVVPPIAFGLAGVYAYSIVFAAPPDPIVYLGLMLAASGAPLLTGVYLSGFVLASATRAGQVLIEGLAPVGRMALTNYMMQSVVLGFIFYGYGLGSFGSLSPSELVLLAIAVFCAQIVTSHVWMERFQYGPCEWVLRAVTTWEIPAWRPRTGWATRSR